MFAVFLLQGALDFANDGRALERMLGADHHQLVIMPDGVNCDRCAELEQSDRNAFRPPFELRGLTLRFPQDAGATTAKKQPANRPTFETFHYS
jgi:hypothetical protein